MTDLVRPFVYGALLSAVLVFALWLAEMALVRVTGTWLGPLHWIGIPIAAAILYARRRRAA